MPSSCGSVILEEVAGEADVFLDDREGVNEEVCPTILTESGGRGDDVLLRLLGDQFPEEHEQGDAVFALCDYDKPLALDDCRGS